MKKGSHHNTSVVSDKNVGIDFISTWFLIETKNLSKSSENFIFNSQFLRTNYVGVKD